MPRKTVFKGEIQHLQILNEQGQVDTQIGVPEALSEDRLLEMYRWMRFFRRFDEKALALQRTGRLGTYASLIGQEAAQVGVAYAMAPQDWLVPSFRDQGLMMVRGVKGSKIITYWNGDERGSCYDEGVNVLPICVPVGSQMLHGVGLAMASAYKGNDTAVVACIGDGGTSEGDFHEACNFAGTYNAPVVMLIQNNQWAISVPRDHQTASDTLAQKAIAYGIEGIQVDGNDVMGMYQAAYDALNKARAGGGPTLIEAFTYRMEDHTTADDASKYRDQSEVDAWKPRDPIARLETYLRNAGRLSDEDIAKMEAEIEQEVAQEVADRDNMDKPDPLDTFRYVYEEIPPHLAKQMAEMQETL
jgi:pyruvate dehydrogenase E1 component alpha subunit